MDEIEIIESVGYYRKKSVAKALVRLILGEFKKICQKEQIIKDDCAWQIRSNEHYVALLRGEDEILSINIINNNGFIVTLMDERVRDITLNALKKLSVSEFPKVNIIRDFPIANL